MTYLSTTSHDPDVGDFMTYAALWVAYSNIIKYLDAGWIPG